MVTNISTALRLVAPLFLVAVLPATAATVTTTATLAVSDSNGNFITAQNVGTTNGKVRIVKTSYSGTIAWNSIYSPATNGTTRPAQVAVDASGNVYVAGTVVENKTGSAGYPYYFLRKYNSSGSVQWTKTAAKRNLSFATGLVLDSSGNAYLLGHYLSSTTSRIVNEIYKYTPSGAQTSLSLSTPVDTFLNYIKISSSNEIYVAGSSDATTSQTIYGVTAKVNPSLVMQWQVQDTLPAYTGNIDRVSCVGLALDSSGNPVTCYKANTFDADPNVKFGTLLKKYTASSGSTLWSNYVEESSGSGVAGNSGEGGVIVDSSGNVAVAGSSRNPFIKSSYDTVLLRFNGTNGTFLNSATGNGSGDGGQKALAQDAGGLYYVLGTMVDPNNASRNQVYVNVFDSGGYSWYTYYYYALLDLNVGQSIVPTTVANEFFLGGITAYIPGSGNADNKLFQCKIGNNAVQWQWYFNN